MAFDVQHWLEVLFDGVGGAALIAFLTAWNERNRENKSAQAPKTAKRRTFWMAIAAVFFVVCLGVGIAIHVLRKSPAAAQQAQSAPPPAHTPQSQPVVPSLEKPPKRVATTADEITALIAEHLQVARADVKPDKDLVLDLGADPLDKAEIVMAIETSYDIQISGNDARKLKSVGDFISYVQRRERNAAAVRIPATGQAGVTVQGNGNGTAVGQGNSVQVNSPPKDAPK